MTAVPRSHEQLGAPTQERESESLAAPPRLGSTTKLDQHALPHLLSSHRTSCLEFLANASQASKALHQARPAEPPVRRRPPPRPSRLLISSPRADPPHRTRARRGHDLAPTAADSLLPIVRTQWDGSPLEGGDKPAEPRAGAANKANKRRKKGGAGTGADDMAGASKSAFRCALSLLSLSCETSRRARRSADGSPARSLARRVINAVKLREEYHAAKKRKLEDATKGKNPNQQKVRLFPSSPSSLSSPAARSSSSS